MKRTKPNGNPNLETFTQLHAMNQIMASNIKQLGLLLARETHHDSTTPIPELTVEIPFQLESSATKTIDFTTNWFHQACNDLHLQPIFHRKIWEFAYTIQAVKKLLGHDLTNKKGLGFGCGEEELASWFASSGMQATVTDLAPDQVIGTGWETSNQHTDSLEKVFHEKIIDRATFDKNVALEFADMNNIPGKYHDQFDLVWSICAFEHLGSIQNGIEFISNAAQCLRPGGVMIHTTEFNYTEPDETIDNWQTVLFRKRDFKVMAKNLINMGLEVFPLNFDTGDTPLDGYIDIPPYKNDAPHLKLAIDGFPSTCFALLSRRPE